MPIKRFLPSCLLVGFIIFLSACSENIASSAEERSLNQTRKHSDQHQNPVNDIIITSTAKVIASSSQQVFIAKGEYQLGSDTKERNWAYQHSPELVRQQRWYDLWEKDQKTRTVRSFWLDRHLVTQTQYAEFIKATGHRLPYISAQKYHQQGFLVHDYSTVKRYLWLNNQPPAGLEEHPVVLVSWHDAKHYCEWKGMRLPQENEWEAACRGSDGNRFPWGNQWSTSRVHHQTEGTAPTGSNTDGASTSGLMDMLGNVFEWTDSPFNSKETPELNKTKILSIHRSLKSCSWDDAPGTCHCGFRHGRAAESRHILIGFRCAQSN